MKDKLINSNILSIYIGYLRASKKIILISSIGLIFSLGLIASTSIYVDSSKPLLFEQVLEDATISQSESGLNIYFSQQIVVADNPSSIITIINRSVFEAIENVGIDDKLHNLTFSSHIEGYETIIEETYQQDEFTEKEIYFRDVSFYELTNAVKNELMQLGKPTSRLPVTSNEGFFLHFGYDFEDKFAPQLTFPELGNQTIFRNHYDEQAVNQSINITGLGITTRHNLFGDWDWRTNTFIESSFPNLAGILNRWKGNSVIFVNNLTEFITTLDLNISSRSPSLEYFGHMDLNIKNIDVYNVETEIEQFARFQIQVLDNFYSDNPGIQGNFYVDFPSEWILRSAKAVADSIFVGVILYAFPIILVALFAANYSFGLINKSLTRFIGIYKTRGLSNRSVFFMLFLDFLVIILVAIVVSIFLIGYPVGSIVLRSDAFLSFNANPDAVIVLVFDSLIQTLVIAGFIIGILVNLSRMIRLSKLTIAETDNPVEKGEPYWKRHHLDIFFLFGGLVGYWLIYESIINQNFGQLGPLLIVILPLMLLTPFLLIIGAIMVFARIFPVILGKIGNKIWEETSSLLGFALKNVIRHRQASTRAVMLIGVLVSFLVMFFVFPTTSIQQDYNLKSYQAGGEGVATSSEPFLYNTTLMNILEANYSDYFEVTNFAKFFISTNTGQGEILAVNTTTFLQAASFAISSETSQSLEANMVKLGDNSTVPGLILHRNQFERRSVTIGDNISIKGQEGTQLFTIIDGFNYWPNLYLNAWDDTTMYGVMSLDYITRENSTADTSMFNPSTAELGYYFNFKPGVNHTEVADWLAANFSLGLTLFEEDHNDFISSINFLVIIGQLNANILVSIFMGVTILLMFAYMQLNERRKEITTEIALGMKVHQLSALFLIESIILLASGIIIGNILGIGLSWMFGNIQILAVQGTTIPPLILIFPWDLILGTELIILILAILGALIPAFIVTKQDISTVFAGE